MTKTRKKHLIFALITVLITVPCFVFYCSSYEAGGFSISVIQQSFVFIPIEFVLAYTSEIFLGSPLAMKIACKAVNPKKIDPFFFEVLVICATVLVMCPWMSFLATILYNGILAVLLHGASFSNFLLEFIPSWLQKIVLNFPFALLSQLFFIQPVVRAIMRKLPLSKS